MVASVGQRTTLECYVDHCGEPIEVKWCKEHGECEDLFPSDNVEIMQTGLPRRRLVSSLTFKEVSYTDTGLYRCYVNREQGEEISHGINVLVSGALGFSFA